MGGVSPSFGVWDVDVVVIIRNYHNQICKLIRQQQPAQGCLDVVSLLEEI